MEADVSDRLPLENAIAQAISDAGIPSLLIASAGIAWVARFEDTPLDAFEKLMAVNYLGSLFAARCVLRPMQQRGSGRICFVSSGAGLIGVPGYSAYSPTKFALRGLAEVLRSELIHQGVRISIAYPPDTDTPMLERELPHRPPETRAVASMAGIWSADAVAKKILRGIDGDHFEIPVGFEISFLQRFYGPTARLVRGYVDLVTKRATR
jgi:3-dehydrosphinganine reductase